MRAPLNSGGTNGIFSERSDGRFNGRFSEGFGEGFNQGFRSDLG